jgi:aminoglycoside phosphotransferase (APT) family kinase protein
VLGVWRLSAKGQPLDICVQRKIEGVLLRDADLPHPVLRQIVVQAGALLSRIHAIPVKGFGYINGNGEGAFLTPESEITAFLAMEAEFHALAKRLELGDRAMGRALRLVIDDERAAQSIEPCLTHNDFSAKHILVANASISGIIDFGEVAGSEPLSDFVRWDYYDAARFPFEWLQEGYTNKHVFDADFSRRLHIKRIAFSLWVMRWYDKRGYAEGVADARAKFVRDLTKLE